MPGEGKSLAAGSMEPPLTRRRGDEGRGTVKEKGIGKVACIFRCCCSRSWGASVSGNSEQQPQVSLAPICDWQMLGAVSQDMKNRQAANG